MYTDSEYSVRIFRRSGSSGTDPECKRNTDSFSCSEDQVIQFPYDLDITGAPGISEGTLYLSEQISGTYQELGNYSITFAKAE